MNKKNIFILLAILLGLIIIAFIIEVPLGKRGEKKQAKESIIFPGFSLDKANSVEIKSRGTVTKLLREDGKWIISTEDKYPVDLKALEEMLNKVKDMKSSLVASKSSKKYSQFEVDSTNGIEVQIMGSEGKDMAHFFVGKMGPDFMSTYLRRADQDRILLVSEYLRSVFDKGKNGWRDKTVISFDSSKAQKLSLIKDNKETLIEAKEDGWQILKPEVFAADKAVVDEIVKDLSNLTADDFIDEKSSDQASLLKEYGLDNPKSRIIINTKDGDTKTLFVGNESEGKYYVSNPDKKTVFTIYKSHIERLFRDLGELKAKSEKPAEANQQGKKPESNN